MLNWMSDNSQPRPFKITEEVGRTGLKAFSGIVQDEFLVELRGVSGYKKYDEMRRNSPVIAALLLAIEQSVRGVTWSYVSDQGDNDPRLEFLQEAQDGLAHSWNDHIIEVLSMLPFGYSLFEVCFKREGGRLLWDKFGIRGQDTMIRWEFDEHGLPITFIQMAPPDYKWTPIPLAKCILYRTRVERNNPEGRSMLRGAYRSYYFSKNIEQSEAIGIERDLEGMPVILVPETASTEEDDPASDVNKAAKIVRNLRRDEQEGVVLPHGWELTLLSATGSRAIDTEVVIKRYESRILMSALSQFLMLGQDKVGSMALSKDQSDFFTMAVNSIADIIADTFTKQAVVPLMKYNGMDTDGVKLDHTKAGDIDLAQIADFLNKTMASNLFTWTGQDEAWLRSVANLPEMDPDDIEQARQAKQDQALKIAQASKPQPPQMGEIGKPGLKTDGGQPSATEQAAQEDQQKMMAILPAEYFKAAPDDNTRLMYERRLGRLMSAYFKGQQERVIKGAKQVKKMGG
jgi:hypothetical protein